MGKKSKRAVNEESKRTINDEANAPPAAQGGQEQLPAPAKKATERPLLRKSSSASLLDTGGTGGGASTDVAAASTAAPRLTRKSSSLRDMLKSASSKAPIDKGAESRRSVNAPSAFTLPPVSAQSHRQSASSTTSQPRRRRRAGDIELQRAATINVVVKYELGQTELRKFKTCFSQIDLDQSGVIDYDEFFEFIDERKTPFSEGLFRMIDADSNGTIDYEEFVHAMVLYCMYTRDEILQFAFDTFDTGKTGAIGEKEFRRLISIINDGKPAFPGNFKNALAEFDRNKDGVLDFDEFKIMNKRYPMLLFPCFRLQDRMQKSTLGEHHWLKLHRRLYDRLKLENYQRKHNGSLPALGVIGNIRKMFGLDARDIYQP